MPDMDTVRTWEGRTMLDREGSHIRVMGNPTTSYHRGNQMG
jgi:hypothetical protein